MKQADIHALIVRGVTPGETAWAELGSGAGTFTMALRAQLGPDADIYSIEADGSRLARQERTFRAGPGAARTTFIEADFTRPLDVPPLNGILIANALHFVDDQIALLTSLRGYLKPSGKLLIVEYDITRGSVYVPYPVSSSRLMTIAAAAGFEPPTLLATVRSRYWSRIYSALALNRA